VEQYDGYLKAAGRNPQDYNTAQLRWIHVAPSRAQAWENSARALHHTASCYAKWFGEANDKPGDDQALVGMPRDHSRRFRPASFRLQVAIYRNCLGDHRCPRELTHRQLV
jgi:hypothetical protein